jgi:hypothetical protein
MRLGIFGIKTQEALIIKIAQKTVNNNMPMMPLLALVNSHCYCGHLNGKNEMKKEKKRILKRI